MVSDAQQQQNALDILSKGQNTIFPGQCLLSPTCLFLSLVKEQDLSSSFLISTRLGRKRMSEEPRGFRSAYTPEVKWG